MPSFLIKIISPAMLPTKASRSPSPSTSAKSGVDPRPVLVFGNILLLESEKSGFVGEPLFKYNLIPPYRSPMKQSKSPSPSISTKSGTALKKLVSRPKGFSDEITCMLAELSIRRVVKAPGVPLKLFVGINRNLAVV